MEITIILTVALQWTAIWGVQHLTEGLHRHIVDKNKPKWLVSLMFKLGKPFSCAVCASHWLGFIFATIATAVVSTSSLYLLILAFPVMYFRALFMELNSMVKK